MEPATKTAPHQSERRRRTDFTGSHVTAHHFCLVLCQTGEDDVRSDYRTREADPCDPRVDLCVMAALMAPGVSTPQVKQTAGGSELLNESTRSASAPNPA